MGVNLSTLKWGIMTTVKDSFISGYLNNKMLEAVKSLNIVQNALEPEAEREIIAKLDIIIKDILSVEV